jgi:quercetin dioxygenase-like cupin family protein
VLRLLNRPIAAILASAVLLAGCSSTPAASTVATPGGSITPVVRTILAGGEPTAASGERLELARYTIQPHTKLAAHHHPGMQLAFIESGRLTYTVISGTVTVNAKDGNTRAIGAGQTGVIETGEWIAEDEQIVHFGANDTDQVVSILASSLFLDGSPPAIVVAPESAAPSST